MSWHRLAIEAIDPAADWHGYPTGLRDRAFLALLSAGLSVAEISRLTPAHLRQSEDHEGALRTVVQWRLGGRRHVIVVLNDHEAAQVLAYLVAARIWGTSVPIIQGPEGRLTAAGLHSIVHTYRRRWAPARIAS